MNADDERERRTLDVRYGTVGRNYGAEHVLQRVREELHVKEAASVIDAARDAARALKALCAIYDSLDSMRPQTYRTWWGATRTENIMDQWAWDFLRKTCERVLKETGILQ